MYYILNINPSNMRSFFLFAVLALSPGFAMCQPFVYPNLQEWTAAKGNFKLSQDAIISANSLRSLWLCSSRTSGGSFRDSLRIRSGSSAFLMMGYSSALTNVSLRIIPRASAGWAVDESRGFITSSWNFSLPKCLELAQRKECKI